MRDRGVWVRGDTYHGGGNSPNLEVVGTHEDLVQALTYITAVPLVEVLWLVGRRADAGLKSGFQQTLHALCLFLSREDSDVVLEWVRNPSVVKADVRNTLVLVPVILLGKSLENNIIEVLVVGEDDMSAYIVQLEAELVR